MKGTYLKFIVVVYLGLHMSVSQIIDLTISSNALFGTDVNNGQCNLIANEILSNLSSLSSVTLNASLTEETIDVWIGGFVHYTKWISFDGCYKSSKESSDGYVFSSDPIKECYERCEKNFGSFSLTNKECFCKREVDKYQLEMCNGVECAEGSSDLCGEKPLTDENDMCECDYSIHNHSHDNPEREGNCMTFVHNGDQLVKTLEECDTKLYYICINEEMTSIKCVYDKVSWYDARMECEGNYKLATLIPPNFVSVIPGGVQAWSSLFRIPTLEFEESNPNSERIDCLSLTLYRNGSFNTRVRSCNESLPLLCKIDIETMKMTSIGNDMNFSMWIIVGIAVFLLAAIFSICVIFRRRKTVGKVSLSNSTADKAENREYDEIEENVLEVIRGKPAVNKTEFVNSQKVDDRMYNTLQENEDQNRSHNVYNHMTDRTYNRLPDVKPSNHNEYDSIQEFKTENSYGHLRKDAHSKNPPLLDSAYDTMATIV